MAAVESVDGYADIAAKIFALEAQIGALYDLVPFGSHCVAADGTYSAVNAMELAWLGLAREDVLGKRKPQEFLSPHSQDKLSAHLQQVGAQDFSALDLELLGANGQERSIAMSFNAHANSDGSAQGNRTVWFDTTESRARSTRDRIAAMAFDSLSGICVTDGNGIILQVNKAFTTLTGYSAQEVRGKSMHMLSSGQHDPAFYTALWTALKTRGSWQGEMQNRRKDGQIFTEWLSIDSTWGDDGVVTHYVGNFFDITISKATQAEISHMAYFDALTQLPNRRLFHDRLNQALAAASRNALCGAVLFVDLDNFKLINDTRGHAAGDLLLIDVANRLRRNVREGDSVGRMGGDEFVVLLENLDASALEAATQARKVAENILLALADAYQIQNHEMHCTASIGITIYSRGLNAAELLQHADLAMYQAKKGGRNTLRFFDPVMQQVVSTRMELEQDLRRALGLHQFELYYQAQVNQAGAIVGAEALLRWHCGTRGTVAPSDFIPLAEETGLILPIGHWVLATACAQVKAWENDAQLGHVRLAVNVSPRQFMQSDFVEQVLAVLDQTGANPARIKLEITESMVLDVEDTVAKMDALQERGIGFSMDDFGTGYSSLSSLTQLPLQQLKIDQSFVHNLALRSADAAIVQTIIGMAHNLQLEVLAEGVETEEQRAFLQTHGCQLYQGYLFSKPLRLQDFEALLKTVGQ